VQATGVLEEDFNETLPDDVTKIKPSVQREVSLNARDFTIHVPGIAAIVRRWGSQRYHELCLWDAG